MNRSGEYARNLLAGLYLSGGSRVRDDGEEVLTPKSRSQEAALVRTQKMAALGLLAGGVAHDFNNLLHVIHNSVEILEHQNLAPESRRYLGMIRRSAEHGTALGRRLLASARHSPPDIRRFDPNELITSVAELLRPTLGARITIQTKLAPDIWPIATDASQLETALLNLAINARDAIVGTGRVRIETANAGLDEADDVGCQDRAEGQYVIIAVNDTGSGMPPHVMERACDPLFTTKAPGQGTGLGLSQVARFTRKAGGRLEISSVEGGGTTVRIFLPRSTALAAHC